MNNQLVKLIDYRTIYISRFVVIKIGELETPLVSAHHRILKEIVWLAVIRNFPAAQLWF